MSEIVRFYDEDDSRISDVAAAYDIAYAVKPDIDGLFGLHDKYERQAIIDAQWLLNESDLEMQDDIDSIRLEVNEALSREVSEAEFAELFTWFTWLEICATDQMERHHLVNDKLDQATKLRYAQWQEENTESLVMRKLAREVDQYECDDDSG